MAGQHCFRFRSRGLCRSIAARGNRRAERGRAGAGVLFGAILVLLIVGAIRWGRSPRRRLEITAGAIRYVPPNGRVSALSRESGDELRFVLRHRGPMSRVWVLGLNIKGTDTIMDVRGEFPRDPIRQACMARGWRFDEQRRSWRGMPQLSRPARPPPRRLRAVR